MIKNFENINPSKEPLTVEKLKTFKGLKDLSDTKAEEIVFLIKNLAAIIIDIQRNEEKFDNELNLAA